VNPSVHNANAAALRWSPLVAWVVLVVFAAPAVGAALADRSRAVQLVGTTGAWVWWAVGLLALLVPTTVALTVVRMLAPAGVLATGWAGLAGGPDAIQLGVGLAATLAAALLVFNGEFGRRFVQGSAYGDEARFPLRPPGVLLLGPIPLFWSVGAVAALAGPLLLAARAFILGVPVTGFAGAAAWLLGRRFHRLSRRWLVFVPAGAVVHDQTVLAETSMFPKAVIAGCALAPAGTEAADFTGNAPGSAIEFRLHNPGEKVVLAPDKEHPGGRALHVRSFFVSPTLPGAALAEARRRGLPGFTD
jgi:hypothetical protein